MGQHWTEVRPSIWERAVEVGSYAAIARVERQNEYGSTWVLRVFWDGTSHVTIGDYATAAHARQALADGILKAMARRSLTPEGP
jgi:hypothetical protein